jgi:7-cyano-7-deazaguanine synthase
MRKNINKAIVLVSGGMDSLVTACIAARENEEVYFLHISYGQRTFEKELEAFTKICEYYEPNDSKVIEISYIKEFGGNSLTDIEQKIPEGISLSVELPNTYVPFRNGNMIAIACGWAEVIDANRIYIGAVEVDGVSYPDCREAFFKAMEKALNLGTKDAFSVEIKTPLIRLTKAEIVRLGHELNVPFDISWSCYQSGEKACGVCDSCLVRNKAFADIGKDSFIV